MHKVAEVDKGDGQIGIGIADVGVVGSFLGTEDGERLLVVFNGLLIVAFFVVGYAYIVGGQGQIEVLLWEDSLAGAVGQLPIVDGGVDLAVVVVRFAEIVVNIGQQRTRGWNAMAKLPPG
ncbi:MAG: hypothetical protein AAF990_14830 [Bacteroidota bacterium]